MVNHIIELGCATGTKHYGLVYYILYSHAASPLLVRMLYTNLYLKSCLGSPCYYYKNIISVIGPKGLR